jgi:hypothetical protein
MKSYGRVNQYLLRVGWERVDDVFGLFDPQATHCHLRSRRRVRRRQLRRANPEGASRSTPSV